MSMSSIGGHSIITLRFKHECLMQGFCIAI
jgi:hypothetical protein